MTKVLERDATENLAFTKHRGPVTCVAGIPGTNRALTSGYDSAVGLVDFDTGSFRLLGYHRHLVNRVTVSPSGARAASSSSDYHVFLWDLQTGRVERVLRGHSDDVDDFAFIDEDTGVSVSQDCRVLIWDLRTGGILRVLEGHEKDVISVAHLGGRVYTCGDDKTLRVWDAATGKQLRVWGPFECETDTCALDPLHQRAVLGCDDGFIRLFDLQSGEMTAVVEGHGSGIKKIAVSPQNGDILTAAYDQRVAVWDAETLRLKCNLERKLSTWERSVCWSPDGRRVLAGTFDGTVMAWDAADGRSLMEVGDGDEGNVCFNEASANAEGEAALVSDDGRVRLACLTSERADWLTCVEPASGRVLMNAVCLDDKEGVVVCGSHDHRLHLFDKEDGELHNERIIHLGEGPINSIRVAHHAGFEGDLFVACYSGAIMRVTRAGQIAARIRLHEGAVKSLRIHPGRPLGISCSSDGFVASWDLDGRMVRPFVGHMAIADDVDIDPSGGRIASVSRDFTLKVFSLDDGRLLHSVALGRRSPKSVCFVEDDMVLVGNYWGELIQVRLGTHTVTRRTIARNGLSSMCRCAGHVLATSYDGGAYLIRPADLTLLQSLRGMVQRAEEALLV
jgi:WD40 repeat protein